MDHRYLAITFSGGGNRAFYQLGIMNRWGDGLLPNVRCFATCSAGAFISTLFLSGRQREVIQFWKDRSKNITRKIDWKPFLSGKMPAIYEPLYRELLVHAFSNGGIDRVRSQPFPILVLTTAIPRWLPSLAAVMLAFFSSEAEKKLRKHWVHPKYGKRVGFTAAIFDARGCETPHELADLIIASSSTPPFTSIGKFDGRLLLDGGVIDNVPAFLADEVIGIERNLVLLTREYARDLIGNQGNRLYIAPVNLLPLNAWGFASPEQIESTIAIGEQTAMKHEDAMIDFLQGNPR